MKFRAHVMLAATLAIAMLMGGCAAQAAGPGGSGGTQMAATELQQAAQALAEVRAAAVAATQPIVVTPATDTQPAVTITPAPEVVKAGTKFTAVIDKAVPYVNAAATVATAAAQPAANLGTTITQAAPLFGPYAGYVALGGLAVTALTGVWGLIQKKKATASQTALTSTVTGVRDALNSGDLTATPKASAVVDAAVVSHPATDELVDAIHAAAPPAALPVATSAH